ncbi:MAG: hypothetical protein ACRED9_14090 [Caulobacteraceae bacterium]
MWRQGRTALKNGSPGGVDGLILAHVARDLLVERRLHRIFAIGLPVLALGQVATMYLWRVHPAWWVATLHRIIYFS